MLAVLPPIPAGCRGRLHSGWRTSRCPEASCFSGSLCGWTGKFQVNTALAAFTRLAPSTAMAAAPFRACRAPIRCRSRWHPPPGRPACWRHRCRDGEQGMSVSTARQAFTTCGGIPSAGNSFSASAPAARAAKASVGVATPECRRGARLGGADDLKVGMRHDDEPAAGLLHRFHIGGGEHGAGADQRPVAEGLGQRADGDERLRRVQRHLDEREARIDQRRADLQRLGGLEAAQDGDQRAGGERLGEAERHGSLLKARGQMRPAARATANWPAAAQSLGARWCGKPRMSAACA